MVGSVSQLRTALLLVDIQNAFNDSSLGPGARSTPGFDNNIKDLLAAFREHGQRVSIIHVHHRSFGETSPLNPDMGGGEGFEFMPFALPKKGESVITKHVNSCFIGTYLEKMLREASIQQLIICGLTTDHCVSTTARMAANLGWRNHPKEHKHVDGGNVVVVEDGVATFSRGRFDADTIHEAALVSLRDEFAEVMTTAEVVHRLF